MSRDYVPQPADTSDIELSPELEQLVEAMARNVHEVWAAGRMDSGWTLGPTRSDQLKTHPCLVPYEELTEQEKSFDRMTSVSTLKFIMKTGFSIERKG